ncbi:MAG: hypothetical protein V3R29_02155 [Candidatus Acidoferrales bacterium]
MAIPEHRIKWEQIERPQRRRQTRKLRTACHQGPNRWRRTTQSPEKETRMKKPIRVLGFAGLLIALPVGASLVAGQEWRVGESRSQVAPPREEGPRLLHRGEVLMPGDPLLVMMAEHQEASQEQYKSMTFEQKVIIERFKPRKRLWKKEKVTMHREIVARYVPDGTGELQATLISDSDRKAYQKYLKNKRKAKAKEEKAYQEYLKAKEEGKEKKAKKAYQKYLKLKDKKEKKSLAKQLIAPILFPMTTENVQHCKFTVLFALPHMVLLRFEPMDVIRDPIFEGQVFVNPQTGEIYRLEIDRLWNFEKVNGKFKHLRRFYVAVDYMKQPGGFRFPIHMKGEGFAKVLFFKGSFRFEITESGYTIASEPLVASASVF